MMKFVKAKISRDQSRDTGMAMVLLLLLLDLRRQREWLLLAAIALHVLNMMVPQIYKLFAVVWLGFSQVLGTVMSRILLSILFFVVVTPVGVLRRLFGKDSLKLREFKASEDSALFVRNHVFSCQDIKKPY